MTSMESAEFRFKFSNPMLPNSFNNFFTKLDSVHQNNIKQKQRNEFLRASSFDLIIVF